MFVQLGVDDTYFKVLSLLIVCNLGHSGVLLVLFV